jgi:SAM-dependent methyltransferase
VLNEVRCVEANVASLAAHLNAECPYDWSITVADNGSSDGTWAVVEEMARSNEHIRALRLEKPGRGGALKEAWTTSGADVVAYMDVDLSTGLEALRMLIDPIVMGQADVAIGSRLAKGAKIERSIRRDVISKIYNVITRVAFRYSVRDAQCGFKAVRSDVAQRLVPLIEDDGWFFDTELLVLAWRSGLKILEVPVRWIEDDDSRVNIVPTARDDLRGIWRLWRGRGRSARESASVVQPSPSTGASVIRPAPRPDSILGPPVDFDEHARGYSDAVDRSVSFTGRDSAFFAKRKVEVLQSLCRRSVGDLASLSVLDVGCGIGTTDRFLVSAVAELHGVDISEEMVAVAHENVSRAEFEWYDGEKLPYPDETFDVSIAICVLHHVPAALQTAFTAEMRRVTKPGGLVAVFEHNPFNPLTRHAVSACELDRGVILLRPSKTRGLLASVGTVDGRSCHFLFSPFGGVLGRTLDGALGWLPFGGQYVVTGRVPLGSRSVEPTSR